MTILMLNHIFKNLSKLKNTMKKLITCFMILCGTYSAQSQDLIKELKKLTLENDSLKSQIIKPLKIELKESIEKNRSEISTLKDKLNTLEKDTVVFKKKILDLNKEIINLNKNKLTLENKKLQDQIKLLTEKNNALNLINEKNSKLISDKDTQIKDVAIREKESGKKEIITSIINSYKNRKFDDLIVFSTLESVQRDKQLIGNNSEIFEVLLNLETYFTAKELLNQKIEVNQINLYKNKLNQIKRESVFIKSLNEKLDNYSTLSLKLKETIININVFDDKLSKKNMVGEGIDKTTRQEKLDKIFSVLWPYVVDYEIKYNDYPYLFDIVLDVIKRKQSNTDEDISDLLKKI
jgi:hypothetical protein